MKAAKTLAGICAFLFVGIASAQVKIVASPAPSQVMPPTGGPVLLDAGKFVFLDVVGAVSPISWDFSVPGIVALPPDGTGDVFGGVKQGSALPDWHKATTKTSVPCLGVKAGVVTVAAWGVADGRAKKLAELTIQVGPRPPPDPEPEPKPPDPKPQPVAKAIWLVVVEESGERTAAVAGVVNGLLVYKDRLAAAGITYRTYDRNSDHGKNYVATAAGKGITGLPFVIVIDKAAKDGVEPLAVFPLPATFTELEAKAKSYTGVK